MQCRQMLGAVSSIWLLRVVCNIKVEYRGVEKIPKGPLDRRLQASVDVGDLCAAAILRCSRFTFSSAS